MSKTNKLREEIDLGEYKEENFSSRESMAEEIERDVIRLMKAKEEWKQEALKAMPEEEEKFIEVYDNSTHRYQIPKSKREDWFKWCEIPEDDERAWEAPKYAERIDGMPIKENRGLNRAIQQCKKALEDL